MNTKPIVAYPSLSSSLNMLPNATSMSNIPLHANMYTNYAQESQSQAKLQKALDKKSQTPSLTAPLSPYSSSHSSSSSDAATLMMRKPNSFHYNAISPLASLVFLPEFLLHVSAVALLSFAITVFLAHASSSWVWVLA
ncbi:hypothetical protein DFH05DRAFT_1529464 [Lentinula detonsa]|uniref:Uncharacterized protein n=1 Tax=Lentinula detonsa TaxID=2804962 RepID=A0A9W8TTH5_9AGAR|nr:hypothetical protein DFH05DRAFT_1529464 [Lentinula detonsa]